MNTKTHDPTIADQADDIIDAAHDPEGETTALMRPEPLTLVPAIDSTVDALAAQLELGERVLTARHRILDTVRNLAIASTFPTDWVLFKAPDERVVGYLQDSGCERVRPLFKISIFDVKDARKVVAADGTYAFVAKGRGKCGLTGDVLDQVEGVRESTEDFCKDLVGIKQEMRVRQAARANLDGKIVRELGGLGNVPIEQLALVWQGTSKTVEHCRKGRGFGTGRQRAGGEVEGAEGVVPPTCPHCGATGVIRTGSRGPFYGCPKFKQHEDKKWLVDLAEWKKDPRSKPAEAPAPTFDRPQTERQDRADEQLAREQATKRSAPLLDEPPPLTDDDIFGGGNRRQAPPPRGRK